MGNAVLVLDANILIRAVLGNKVRNFLINFNNTVDFFTPDVCLEDAKKYLPILFEKRALPSESALEILSNLECLIKVIDKKIYADQMIESKKRIQQRDVDDWPVVATALTFNSPLWTEDQDFFGTGLALWTTDRIHLFFEAHEKNSNVHSLLEKTVDTWQQEDGLLYQKELRKEWEE